MSARVSTRQGRWEGEYPFWQQQAMRSAQSLCEMFPLDTASLKPFPGKVNTDTKLGRTAQSNKDRLQLQKREMKSSGSLARHLGSRNTDRTSSTERRWSIQRLKQGNALRASSFPSSLTKPNKCMELSIAITET